MTPDPQSRRRPLVASPSREQVAQFARLTVEERYLWWSDTLLALFEMASPEARAAWRRHRSHDPERR
ncbi:MAG: hypothetical protein AMXMBFR64_56990 [Myxococcales bacterium]